MRAWIEDNRAAIPFISQIREFVDAFVELFLAVLHGLSWPGLVAVAGAHRPRDRRLEAGAPRRDGRAVVRRPRPLGFERRHARPDARRRRPVARDRDPARNPGRPERPLHAIHLARPRRDADHAHLRLPGAARVALPPRSGNGGDRDADLRDAGGDPDHGPRHPWRLADECRGGQGPRVDRVPDPAQGPAADGPANPHPGDQPDVDDGPLDGRDHGARRRAGPRQGHHPGTSASRRRGRIRRRARDRDHRRGLRPADERCRRPRKRAGGRQGRPGEAPAKEPRHGHRDRGSRHSHRPGSVVGPGVSGADCVLVPGLRERDHELAAIECDGPDREPQEHRHVRADQSDPGGPDLGAVVAGRRLDRRARPVRRGNPTGGGRGHLPSRDHRPPALGAQHGDTDDGAGRPRRSRSRSVSCSASPRRAATGSRRASGRCSTRPRRCPRSST